MITGNLDHRTKQDQMRSYDTLTCQIKSDFTECQKRWVRITSNETDSSEIEKVLQIIAWIKTGINELQGIAGTTIEGLSWGEMEMIVREIDSIQNEIRMKMEKLIF